jgi:hypothetical protein
VLGEIRLRTNKACPLRISNSNIKLAYFINDNEESVINFLPCRELENCATVRKESR